MMPLKVWPNTAFSAATINQLACPNNSFMFSCFGTDVLPRRDEGSDEGSCEPCVSPVQSIYPCRGKRKELQRNHVLLCDFLVRHLYIWDHSSIIFIILVFIIIVTTRI